LRHRRPDFALTRYVKASGVAMVLGGARPHAISSLSGTFNGASNPTFAYDDNGNMTAGAGRSVVYRPPRGSGRSSLETLHWSVSSA